MKIFLIPTVLTVRHIDQGASIKIGSTVGHETRALLLVFASSLSIVHRPGQQVNSVQYMYC